MTERKLKGFYVGVDCRVSTDTRTLQAGDLFFALKGERFDGHDFIRDAFDKGVRDFVISDEKKVPADLGPKAHFRLVPDTVKTYGDLAQSHRKRFKVTAVAVTGSSGKTTVKELLAHLLSRHLGLLKNQGTENNLIGVPKTLLRLEGKHQVLVLELGTNHPGEIERLASIVAPQMAVLTQIGPAHLEGLKDEAGVREEKLSLLKHLEHGGTLFMNGEDPWLRDIHSGVHRIVRVGFSKETADFFADQVWSHENGSSFKVEGKLFQTQLMGRHNILNCLLALAVARAMGVEFSALQKDLESFAPVAGRLCKRTIEGIHFLDDSYNSNPGSFKASLEVLKHLNIREGRGVVCGEMLELGEHSEARHREIGAWIARESFDFVIAAGIASQFLVEEAMKNGFDAKRINHVKDSAAAGRLCREWAKPGDWVLVKGSRGTHMEKVFECFITSSIR